jgi:hypothetical protein
VRRRPVEETKIFSVDIEVHEHPDHTEAKALLGLGDDKHGGWGRARRNPDDPERPRLGEELAIARALADLARHLGGDVNAEIEAAEGKPAHVHL